LFLQWVLSRALVRKILIVQNFSLPLEMTMRMFFRVTLRKNTAAAEETFFQETIRPVPIK